MSESTQNRSDAKETEPDSPREGRFLRCGVGIAIWWLFLIFALFVRSHSLPISWVTVAFLVTICVPPFFLKGRYEVGFCMLAGVVSFFLGLLLLGAALEGGNPFHAQNH
jgi:hypothetical protein